MRALRAELGELQAARDQLQERQARYKLVSMSHNPCRCCSQGCGLSAIVIDLTNGRTILKGSSTATACMAHAEMCFPGCSDQLATAAREELLQQRVSAAEDTAVHASATAAALREEAGRLGAANGQLHADCETLRGRLSEAEPALVACQAQLQVTAC